MYIWPPNPTKVGAPWHWGDDMLLGGWKDDVGFGIKSMWQVHMLKFAIQDNGAFT